MPAGEVKHFQVKIEEDGVLKYAMTGTGDADVYLRRNQKPTFNKFDERPYLDGSEESGTIGVKAGDTLYGMVHAYTDADFELKIER